MGISKAGFLDLQSWYEKQHSSSITHNQMRVYHLPKDAAQFEDPSFFT